MYNGWNRCSEGSPSQDILERAVWILKGVEYWQDISPEVLFIVHMGDSAVTTVIYMEKLLSQHYA